MDSSGLIALLVGVLLCFYGIRSVNLALLAAGFSVGYLIADAFTTDSWTKLWVGLGSALLMCWWSRSSSGSRRSSSGSRRVP